jgi:hypothetical protein
MVGKLPMQMENQLPGKSFLTSMQAMVFIRLRMGLKQITMNNGFPFLGQ